MTARSFEDLMTLLMLKLDHPSEACYLPTKKTFLFLLTKKPDLLPSLLSHITSLIDQHSFLPYMNLLNEHIQTNLPYQTQTYLQDSLFSFLKNAIQLVFYPENTKDVELQDKQEALQTLMELLLKPHPLPTTQLILELIQPSQILSLAFCQLLTTLIQNYQTQLEPNIIEITSKLLPQILNIQELSLKKSYCMLFTAIASTTPPSQQSSDLLLTLFDIVYNSWLPHSPNMPELFYTLGHLSPFLNQAKLLALYNHMHQNFLAQEMNGIILKGFAVFMESVLEKKLDIDYEGLYKVILDERLSLNFQDGEGVFLERKVRLELARRMFEHKKDMFVDLVDKIQGNQKIQVLWLLKSLIPVVEFGCPGWGGFMAGLQHLVYEQDVEVRYVIGEIVLTLVQKGYFHRQEHLFLIQFIIKQASLHDQEIKDKNPNTHPYQVDLGSLRHRTQQIITIISQDPQQISLCLFPFMLQFITNPQYSPGLPFMFKTLSHCIVKCKESGTVLSLKQEKDMSVPSEADLLTRLILLLHLPFTFNDLGKRLLEFLPNICPFLHEAIVLDTQLLQNLNFMFSQQEQNNSLIGQIFKSILSVLPQPLISSVFDSLQSQFMAQLQSEIILLQGILLSYLKKQDLVKTGIENMLRSCHQEYSNGQIDKQKETSIDFQVRKSTAEGLGYISMHWFDLVVEKVRELMQAEVVNRKQPSGFMSYFSKQEDPTDIGPSLKQTLILTLGYVAFHCQPETLILKIDSCVLNHLNPYLQQNASPLQEECLYSLLLISKSLEKVFQNIESLPPDFVSYISKQRNTLIQKAMELQSKNRELGLQVVCGFYRLEPALDQQNYISFFNESLQLQGDADTLVEQSIDDLIYTMIHHDKLETEGEEFHWVEIFQYVISQVIQKVRSSTQDPLQVTKIYFKSIVKALNQKKIKIENSRQKKAFLKCLTQIIGFVYINDWEIRDLIVTCFEKLFIGLNNYETVQFRSQTEFNKTVYDVIVNKMAETDIFQFQEELLAGLETKNPVVFEGIYELFDSLLQNYPPQNLTLTLTILFTQYEENPSQCIPDSLFKIYQSNLSNTLNTLLTFTPSFPLHPLSASLLTQICLQKPLIIKTLNLLTDIINNPESQIVEDIVRCQENAVLYLGFLLQEKSGLMGRIVKQIKIQVLATLLMALFQEDCNKTFALWSITKLLEIMEREQLIQALESGLGKKLQHNLHEGFLELLHLFFKDCQMNEVLEIIDFFDKFLDKKNSDQHLVVVATYGYLLTVFKQNYLEEDLQELQDRIHSIIQTLLQTIKDKNENVRKQSVKGLGNISYLLKGEGFILELSSETCADILNSLFFSLEDISKLCVREVLLSLQKIIEYMDLSVVEPCLHGLLVRLPGSFERDDAIVRMSAFNLFGKLCKLLHALPRVLSSLQDHIHYHIISILLHIFDGNSAVQSSAIESLQKISQVLELGDLEETIVNFQESKQENYLFLDRQETFVFRIVEHLFTHFEEKFQHYLVSLQHFCSSPDDTVRAATGFLMSVIFRTLKECNNSQKDKVYEKLESLLNDESDKVKVKTIRSLQLLA